MTKEEFEKYYANNCGFTVQELHNQGLYAEPCDCDYEKCKGWQMVFKKENNEIHPL